MTSETKRIMKEMGRVKRNHLISTNCINHHRRHYNHYAKYCIYREKREHHKQQLDWWTARAAEIEEHLDQLHRLLQQSLGLPQEPSHGPVSTSLSRAGA